jgi:hypothetical protein
MCSHGLYEIQWIFVVFVVKLIHCVSLIFNNNKFFLNQSPGVLNAIFNFLSNSVRSECDTKILIPPWVSPKAKLNLA